MIRFEASERFIRRLKIATWLLLFLVALGFYLFSGRWEEGVSVLVGGVIALLNFQSLHRDVKGVVQNVAHGLQTAQRATRVYLFKYYLRLIATAIVLYFVIKLQIIKPLPFLVGISLIMVNILLCFLREVGRNFWLKFKEG
ncbi:MAG TPA: ATP synthase subunit I [Thermodesulfatator atlanticus]|uniref:ATP synthase subunit I n=1 Tax=Thermodesulfatator atlanticus TaxID=501497 RepID=A0A7V5NZY0_9BACT|nr:ATP synthase subunit I [Thermodesulfatator atlanticus]